MGEAGTRRQSREKREKKRNGENGCSRDGIGTSIHETMAHLKVIVLANADNEDEKPIRAGPAPVTET